MLSTDPKLVEATHDTVAIDKNQFMELIRYFSKNDLIDGFDSYLDKKNATHLNIDKNFANHLKTFLLSERHVADATPRNAIMCSCIRSAY
ncbi:hypothetical protein [Spirosoma flavum]|uniref:hypothetical protein n=1 Tax=Spirosoma flavum TaxID=2048557 RepID=UPI0036D24ECD